MVDRVFSEPRLAAVYDVFCAWETRPERDFYVSLVMSARSVPLTETSPEIITVSARR